MQFEIMGKEKVDYISKKSGQPVRGTNLHCVVDGQDSRVEGIRVERLYCKESIDCGCFALGDHIEVFYNKWGSVDTVHLV